MSTTQPADLSDAPASFLDFTRPDLGGRAMGVLRRNLQTLRTFCRRFNVEPTERILERVASIYDRRPEWVTAEAHPTDLLILYVMAMGLRPTRVVEIGVASGLSTCAMLAGLADAGVPARNARDQRATVQSFDILETVPWSTQHRIGAAIPVVLPQCADAVKVNTSRTSMDLERELGEVRVDMAFIDGAHNHPWPLIDAIQLCKVASEGCWFVLHDVALSERAMIETQRLGLREIAFEPCRGAEWLFEMWSSDKVRGCGAAHNVGAVRAVPLQSLRMQANLQELVALPWESSPPPKAVEVLYDFCGREAVEQGMLLGRPGASLLR